MEYEKTVCKCPGCGKTVDSTSKYCPYCGKEILRETRTVCGQCGAELEPGAKFCDRCGEPVSEKKPESERVFPGRPPFPFGPKSGSFTWWPESDRMEDLCGSLSCLVLTIALTVQLVCQVLFHFNVFNLIGNIPKILICIGCWMCFVGAQQHSLTSSGFRLISGTLTFLRIAACVGSGLGCLLGIFLMGVADETRGAGFVVFLVFAACIYFIWKYWSQLRQAVKAALAVVQTGSSRIPTSMYSIVLLYIGAASELIALANSSSAQGMINGVYEYLYLLDLPYEVEGIVYRVLDQLSAQTASFTAILGNIAAVVVPLVAGLILQRIQKEQKQWIR